MMKQFRICRILAVLLVVNCSIQNVGAQESNEPLERTILHLDSLFWNTYNTCNVTASEAFFTSDIEFYHDKGGITLGANALMTSFKNNLCSNPDFRLRREAVKGTVRVFPMQKDGQTYGAIISGEHVFYIIEKGKNERLDGQANFTHLWILKDNVWKMSRILSYNHHPADYINKRKETVLSSKQLDELAGEYKSAKAEPIFIRRSEGALMLEFKGKKSMLYPEGPFLFFAKEHDLTFEFVPGKNQP